MKISSDINENLKTLNAEFTDCSDIVQRKLKCAGRECVIISADGLVNSFQLCETVVKPLSVAENISDLQDILPTHELVIVDDFNDIYDKIYSGFAVIFIDGYNSAYAVGIQQFPKRSIPEPSEEADTKCAKETFIENLNDNRALIRRRLKTSDLKLKQLSVSQNPSTAAVIAYVNGIASSELVGRVEDVLRSFNVGAISSYGEILAALNKAISSPFSTVSVTERPDKAVSLLLQGRVLLLVDGVPFAVIVPTLFSDNFQSVDDYVHPPIYASFIRILRYFSFVISIFLPAFYVAVGTFHQELIPTGLLFTIAAEEITTPYSLMTEAIILLLMYEIMREAGLRLPKAVGHAVSIIGGIVIGETTVSAGLVGAPMLVVIALTAISSYVVSNLYEPVSVLRFVFIIVGGYTGMFGVILGAAVMCVNICAVNSYGVPYSAPISPLTKSAIGDVFVRRSWKFLEKNNKKNNNISSLRGVTIDNADSSEK